MANNLLHYELNGGYTGKKKVIIDLVEIGDTYEAATIYEDGEELEIVTTDDIKNGIKTVDNMFMKYAGDTQKAFYKAASIDFTLKQGERYTLALLSEFGFPVTLNFTFKGAEYRTHAQHSDVVRLLYIPKRSHTTYALDLYNRSFIICKGWQELDESVIYNIKENDGITTKQSKYACFDSRYIDDMEKAFKDIIVIHKDYKTGVNGKIYA